MRQITDDKNRYFIYEVKLPEKLMEQVKYFAGLWNEDIDLCIGRVLKSGLIARKEIKFKLRDELSEGLFEERR